ncbi:PREDICTED: LOW QUALITY PROTEIN: myosin-2 essential light chain-like [Priapulus caudatus]|uniref:LOW QUALITY PROTEIN: myosin-2 essential light chain-like n=1 Tax=Priapulus caudatus TaxID=37621 RepID=A0ABM1ETL3_PRICU|nr:PREDICTED: LOW QUALITY PROTEIN: myosin-2 essential light chain-like [Priapulus caudatus]
MSALTEDQIADYQDIFGIFDNRGDGNIAASQIGEALRAMGQNPTEAEVKRCGYHDKPEMRISFETFLPILQTVVRNCEPSTAADFIEGLRVFDKEGNGFMSCAELRHLLTTIGEKLSDEEVEMLTTGMEDFQGNINYEDMVRVVLNG